MSIVAHGSDRFACVCRCSSGLRRASSPAIQAFAGENVCIQAITPMQFGGGACLQADVADLLGAGQHRLGDDA